MADNNEQREEVYYGQNIKYHASQIPKACHVENSEKNTIISGGTVSKKNTQQSNFNIFTNQINLKK